jgi:hypothetical protein
MTNPLKHSGNQTYRPVRNTPNTLQCDHTVVRPVQTANSALRDAAHRRYREVLYLQNAARSRDTRINVTARTATTKVRHLCVDFHQIHKTLYSNYVQVSYAEFRRNRAMNVGIKHTN